MNTSRSWFGQLPNMSPASARFSTLVAISLVLGGEGGCGAGLSAHGLPGSADCEMGVRGAVLIYGDVNALGGKLRRLMGLHIACVSSSGPSRSSKSGVGLLLGCAIIMVSFLVLLAGAFSLALNQPFWPCGCIVHLLGGMGVLCYVCFAALVLIIPCLIASCMAWLRYCSRHHVGRGSLTMLRLVHWKGQMPLLISSMYLVIILVITPCLLPLPLSCPLVLHPPFHHKGQFFGLT
jgi:hypothetical protein